MAKGRPCTCPFCKTPVNKEEAFEYKRKYYHQDCFGALSKQTVKIEQSAKKQKVEKAKENVKKDTLIALETDISDDEILAKEKVIIYLKELLKVKRLSPKVYKLLKDYYITYKFSYKGMLTALKYFYEVQGNQVTSDGIGIIPYIYEEAQEYEKTKEALNKEAEKINLDEAVTYKVIKIKKPQNTINHKLIDIAELEV